MKHELTPDQIETYRENGFVVIDGFLDAHELQTWREAVGRAVAERAERKLPDRTWVGDMEDDEKYYESVFTQRLNLWVDNPGVRELMLDERLGRMAGELAGVNGIRIWHDQALFKPAWGNPTAWHLDAPFWSFTSREAISIWVALDDVTKDNGCCYFMPGSHRDTRFDNPGITPSMASLFDFYPELAARPVVAAEMSAGSCSFHNGLVVHGAHANMSAQPRRAMTCAYMPDGVTYNGQRNILPKALSESLAVGAPLNDNERNPLLWSRS